MTSNIVIDADGHVNETDEQLRRHMDGPVRFRSTNHPFYPFDGWDRELGDRLGSAAESPAVWIGALERGGMDMAVLYPTSGLFLGFVRDPDWAVTLARAYNNLMHHEYLGACARLKAVALLPVQEPAEAARELRRAVTTLGFVGGMLVADGPHLLGDSRFGPIYEEAQRLDVPLAVHASGSHLGGAGVDRYARFIQAHTVSHPFGQMRQMTSIVFEGILERFPSLRIAFLEAGAGWVPYWMERMDHEFEKRGDIEAPSLRRPPSEYLRSGRVYVSCETDERLLPETIRLLGAGQIVYASDFPHWDHSYPASIDELRRRDDLSAEHKQRILAENARVLYRLS
jgi:predicted TIM-barrel fold metal-dependent hydrolase